MRFMPLSLLAACGFTPAEGTWLYANEQEVENTCGFDYEPTSGTFTLQDNGDGNLVIDPEDGSDPFLCVIDDDHGYECPQRYVEAVDIGLGAVVEVRASAEGSFRSAKAGEGSQTAVLSCQNPTCEAAAAVAGVPDPCQISVSYDVAWSEE